MQVLFILNLYYTGEDDQIHALPVCPQGKRSGTHYMEAWMVPKAGLDVLEKRNIV